MMDLIWKGTDTITLSDLFQYEKLSRTVIPVKRYELFNRTAKGKIEIRSKGKYVIYVIKTLIGIMIFRNTACPRTVDVW